MWIRPSHCCSATLLQTDDKVHLHFWAVGLSTIMERFFFLFLPVFLHGKQSVTWQEDGLLWGRREGKSGWHWLCTLNKCIAEPSPLDVVWCGATRFLPRCPTHAITEKEVITWLERNFLQTLPSASNGTKNPSTFWSADTVPAWADLLGSGRKEECCS